MMVVVVGGAGGLLRAARPPCEVTKIRAHPKRRNLLVSKDL